MKMANTQAMRRKAYPGHREAHNKFYKELNKLSGAYEEAKDLAAVDPEGISDAEEISKKVIMLGKKMSKHFTEMKQMKHEKSLVFTSVKKKPIALTFQKAQQKTLTGGHQSDSWDRRLKNLVLVPPPAPLERDLSKETKKNKKKLKEILGTPLDVQYGVNVPR